MIKEQKFSVQRFFCKKKYKNWTGVFEEYTNFTDRYIRVYLDQYDEGGGDAPYWNNERTNIGMLAASCWANGWVALEEFSTEKTKEDRSNGTGRCDLWVSSQNGKENFAIEAKKGDSSLASKDLISNLKKILESACADAENLREEEGDIRLGVAFMHLYLVKSKLDQTLELVNNTISEIEKYSGNVDFTYVYLKDNGVTSDSGSIIPGVIIVGRSIEKIS